MDNSFIFKKLKFSENDEYLIKRTADCSHAHKDVGYVLWDSSLKKYYLSELNAERFFIEELEELINFCKKLTMIKKGMDF